MDEWMKRLLMRLNKSSVSPASTYHHSRGPCREYPWLSTGAPSGGLRYGTPQLEPTEADTINLRPTCRMKGILVLSRGFAITDRLDARNTCLDLQQARHTNVVLMLGQRLRRWPSIKPTLVGCFVFAGFAQEAKEGEFAVPSVYVS